MASDPREAYKAVRRSVYKSVLGGQVNILNPKGGASSSGSSFVKARKLDNHPHQRGGNRRKRTARTDQVDGYVARTGGLSSGLSIRAPWAAKRDMAIVEALLHAIGSPPRDRGSWRLPLTDCR